MAFPIGGKENRSRSTVATSPDAARSELSCLSTEGGHASPFAHVLANVATRECLAGWWSGPDIALNVGVTQEAVGWNGQRIHCNFLLFHNPDTRSSVWVTPHYRNRSEDAWDEFFHV